LSVRCLTVFIVKNSKNRSTTETTTDRGSNIYKSNEEKMYEEDEVENINAAKKKEEQRGYC